MFSSRIESLLASAGASELTEIFCYILFAILVISLLLKVMNSFRQLTNYTPNLLTTIGILGTFTGIVSGLLGFDPENIDGSIGPLLEGLKTAFITSLVGMSLSILYKIIVSMPYFEKFERRQLSEEDIGNLEIYNKLKEMVDGINLLKATMSDNDDSSIVGQIRLFRNEVTDHVKKRNDSFKSFEMELWSKLERFSEMLSKAATEQVIEALNKVIADFNNNLEEQFGENFKQLNAAVKELVTWQENYKEQLSEMKVQYDHGVQSISLTKDAVSTISVDTKNIPETMSRLKEVMEVNQHQISELDRHLQSFKEIRDKAVEAVPEIRGQIEKAIAGAQEANEKLSEGIKESTDQVKKAILETAEDYRSVVDKTRGALTESANETANSSIIIKEQFSDAISEVNSKMRVLIEELVEGGKNLNSNYSKASTTIIGETKSVQDAFTNSIEEMRKLLNKQLQEQAEEQYKTAEKILSGLERKIEDSLSQTGEATQKQVAMIEKAMEKELEKVMNSMGSALASISGQFTNDYSKLVSQMNQIVNRSITAN